MSHGKQAGLSEGHDGLLIIDRMCEPLRFLFICTLVNVQVTSIINFCLSFNGKLEEKKPDMINQKIFCLPNIYTK